MTKQLFFGDKIKLALSYFIIMMMMIIFHIFIFMLSMHGQTCELSSSFLRGMKYIFRKTLLSLQYYIGRHYSDCFCCSCSINSISPTICVWLSFLYLFIRHHQIKNDHNEPCYNHHGLLMLFCPILLDCLFQIWPWIIIIIIIVHWSTINGH